VARHRGGHRPRAARAFSLCELEAIVSVAEALPEHWCVSIEPYSGQVSIGPTAYLPLYKPFVRGGDRAIEGLRQRRITLA